PDPLSAAPGPGPVPVLLLTGFLGAGKTTVLNHLLRESRGTRIGVVVNDFGAIEIDAMTVAGQVGSSMVSLGDGCLCCAVDASELDAYLDRLTAPGLGIDVVVIEASGLAEPRELVRMLLASDNPRVRYGGLVEVVDAAEYEAVRERHPSLERQLAVADLVVLNKADRAGEEGLAKVAAAVANAAPGTPAVAVSYGRLDPGLLLDRRPRGESFGQLSFEDVLAPEDHGSHLHAAYDSTEFSSRRPMDPRRLMAFLDARPEGLYRIKGYVDFGAADPGNRYALHAVGRFLRFTPEPWAAGEECATRLVLIGMDMDGEGLTRALTACEAPDAADTGTAAPDESAMWGVLRYVASPEDWSPEA
ncbi:CobW family GTP-binding protein, partial [Streptomyces sp. 8L]|uniref:CobW family GTP-binding protein n=1 Tax=Streptomyces sp. 8L TaxID=2877242 RepID=UPI0035A8C9A0